jgi:hypothetical protein
MIGVPTMPASSGKDLIMWVFDGEEWTKEGSTERKPESTALPMWDQSMPELQVIEHLPSTRTNEVPPYPLP